MLIVRKSGIFCAILVLNVVIVIEMRPNHEFHPQNEDFHGAESPSTLLPWTDDEPMNADSFPLAPDVQDSPRMGSHRDHHNKNDRPKTVDYEI